MTKSKADTSTSGSRAVAHFVVWLFTVILAISVDVLASDIAPVFSGKISIFIITLPFLFLTSRNSIKSKSLFWITITSLISVMSELYLSVFAEVVQFQYQIGKLGALSLFIIASVFVITGSIYATCEDSVWITLTNTLAKLAIAITPVFILVALAGGIIWVSPFVIETAESVSGLSLTNILHSLYDFFLLIVISILQLSWGWKLALFIFIYIGGGLVDIPRKPGPPSMYLDMLESSGLSNEEIKHYFDEYNRRTDFGGLFDFIWSSALIASALLLIGESFRLLNVWLNTP